MDKYKITTDDGDQEFIMKSSSMKYAIMEILRNIEVVKDEEKVEESKANNDIDSELKEALQSIGIKERGK